MEERHQRICLIHYHEIGLKGRNRSVFEKRLLKNVEALLSDFPVVTIHRISGRLCVFLREGTTFERALEVAATVRYVPGVARVSCGFKCERDLSVMNEVAINALAETGDFESFKVLYARSERGVGGLPVGSSGRVACLLSSGSDSPVALWKMARRGAICIGVHFSGRPQTSDTSEYLVDDIAHVLERTGCIARVYVVPFGDYQKEIALTVPPSLRVIMYRRLMFKVAERIALREKAGALVTGESLGQVASQTLDNIRATDHAVDMPVFRPLIGSDKLDIIEDAQRLGTFEISSQDAPDCCTLFMPRNPETHAKIPAVLEAEAALPLDRWIDELVESAEPHDYACPSYRPR